MRFPPEDEAIILLRLDEAPSRWCLQFPADQCKADGDAIIYRDGLRILLHRHLWQLIHGHPLDDDLYMLSNPACQPPSATLGRCAHPLHRIISKSSVLPRGRSPRPSTATGAPSAPDINAAKTHCPANHEYTEENTYLWTDRDGNVHRKCRRCTLRRTRQHHAAERANRKASS